MGLFDLFSLGTSKKIYRDKFRKKLRGISDLSDKERAYTEEVFDKEIEGGLSKFEIKKKCKEIKHKTGDILEPSEVEKIKEKLLEHFE